MVGGNGPRTVEAVRRLGHHVPRHSELHHESMASPDGTGRRSSPRPISRSLCSIAGSRVRHCGGDGGGVSRGSAMLGTPVRKSELRTQRRSDAEFVRLFADASRGHRKTRRRMRSAARSSLYDGRRIRGKIVTSASSVTS